MLDSSGQEADTSLENPVNLAGQHRKWASLFMDLPPPKIVYSARGDESPSVHIETLYKACKSRKSDYGLS